MAPGMGVSSQQVGRGTLAYGGGLPGSGQGLPGGGPSQVGAPLQRPGPATSPSAVAPPALDAPAPPTPIAGTPLAAIGPNGHLATQLSGLGLTEAQVSAVLALSREVVERVVWEVVPVLAETLIKEEIKRLTSA